MNTHRFLSALALAACLGSAAHADAIPVPPMPGDLQVDGDFRPFLMTHAVGTQNYMCLPRPSGNGLGWTFIGPQATLFDDEGEQAATHYLSVNPDESLARATWQDSQDSSAVWAMAVATSTDAKYVAQGAIPWLKLQVVGWEDGPTGGDRLSDTKFIQRVNTLGGTAPTTDCPSIGARLFAAYETDYIFYRAR